MPDGGARRSRESGTLVDCGPARGPAAHRTQAQEAPMHATSQIGIPESMRVEHAEIHDELVRATKLPGRIGDAARALTTILHPHFVREEEIALPPLGLLAPLARGDMTAEMADVLVLTDALRAELPRMLE